MKKICVLLLAVLLLMSTACAEIDVHGMTDEELYALRTEINNEIADRAQAEYMRQKEKTIANLFPDPWLAEHIRKKVGALSTEDIVSQEDLDEIVILEIDGKSILGAQLTSLEGIQYLQNLEILNLLEQESISEIPDWIGNLENLRILNFTGSHITKLPDSICDLVNLEFLNISGTNVSALPENIGKLSNLHRMSINETNITTLPESIGNLSTLKILNISNTKITELPESFSSLDLGIFECDGLDLD